MGDAIKAAGFDPDKLRELAPPPGKSDGKEQRAANRESGTVQK